MYVIHWYCRYLHREYRMPGFLSSRMNWPPLLPHQQERVDPPPPFWFWEGDTLACERLERKPGTLGVV
jgi:hypothetical protein